MGEIATYIHIQNPFHAAGQARGAERFYQKICNGISESIVHILRKSGKYVLTYICTYVRTYLHIICCIVLTLVGTILNCTVS